MLIIKWTLFRIETNHCRRLGGHATAAKTSFGRSASDLGVPGRTKHTTGGRSSEAAHADMPKNRL